MAGRWPPMSDEEFERQYAEAVERGKLAERTEPRAVSARYNPETRRIELELRNGCLFAFPVDIVQDLAGATDEQLAAVELWGNGHALRWEELDTDFGVPGLLEARFGNEKWMEQWGGSGWNARVTPKEEHAAVEPVRHRKAS